MKIKNIFILGALICTSSAVLASSAPVIAIQPESQAVIESYEATTSNSVIAQGGYTALNSIVLNPSGSATAYATVDDDGKYILHAGGGDYWNNTEVGCLYLYKDVEGDFDVVLCVESIENNNVWSKVGLAFRSTLDGNSSHVSVLATPSQVQTTYRSPSGSDSKETWPLLIDGNFVEEESINYKDVTYPSNWIRLKREGDHFTAYRSLDGNYWTRLNEGDFTTVDKNTARQMPVEGYLGIVYSAQDQNNYHTAVVSQYNPQYVAPALPTPDPSNYAFTIVGYEDGGVEGFYDYDAETGMFSVWGCGSDVWGTNDHFSYLYRPVPAGDFSLTVKLNDFPATSNGWAKAGLMLRESAADGTFPNNSRYVLMNTQRSYNTSNGLFRSAWRSTIGLDVNDNRSESSPSDYRYPNWQRIERVGNVVFCYYSRSLTKDF